MRPIYRHVDLLGLSELLLTWRAFLCVCVCVREKKIEREKNTRERWRWGTWHGYPICISTGISWL